jgi:hypothetical protein
LANLGEQRDVERAESLARFEDDLPGVKGRTAADDARTRLHTAGWVADLALGEQLAIFPLHDSVGARGDGGPSHHADGSAMADSLGRHVAGSDELELTQRRRGVAHVDRVAVDHRLVERRRVDRAGDRFGEPQAEQLGKRRPLAWQRRG